jgi:hypothetical protein
VLRAGTELAGVREVAIPSTLPGSTVAALLRHTPITSVVRFDVAPGDRAKSLASAADRVSTGWTVTAADLARHAPSVVTDLAIATMFSPEDRVVARPGTEFDSAFDVVTAGADDVSARRSVDVARGVDHDRSLLAWT